MGAYIIYITIRLRNYSLKGTVYNALLLEKGICKVRELRACSKIVKVVGSLCIFAR